MVPTDRQSTEAEKVKIFQYYCVVLGWFEVKLFLVGSLLTNAAVLCIIVITRLLQQCGVLKLIISKLQANVCLKYCFYFMWIFRWRYRITGCISQWVTVKWKGLWRQNLDVFVAWRINMWDTCCIIERSPPVGELGFSSYSCVLQVKNLAKSTFRVCQALLIFHNTRNLEPKTNTVPAHHLIAVVNQSRALCKQTLDILVGRNLLKSFLYYFFVFF